MIYPIYVYGQPVLRKESIDITFDYPELNVLIDNMFCTMSNAEGVGLAAPQIGKDIRLVVISLEALAEDNPQYKNFRLVLINPRIIDYSKESVAMEEGCLSLPGIHEKVIRSETITIEYNDDKFEKKREVFSGFIARVIQHEYDHLEGKLFIDHIAPIRKQLIKNKLGQIQKGKSSCEYRTKSI